MIRFPRELLLVGILTVFLSACGGNTWLRVRKVPENGFAETLNYRFQATVSADSLGKCRTMSVEVRPINKVYSGGEPPSRLQLFDEDCRSPVRFERAQFISNQTGQPVRLHGSQVDRFLSEFVRLEDELLGWLWRSGVI